jgi:hypothetical protein
MKLKQIESLNKDSKNKKFDKYTLTFAEHLKVFINNKTQNEEKQKEMLKIATKQFKNINLSLIKENCNKCYGRGFVGYNTTYKHYVPCLKCFKPNQ